MSNSWESQYRTNSVHQGSFDVADRLVKGSPRGIVVPVLTDKQEAGSMEVKEEETFPNRSEIDGQADTIGACLQ